MRSLHRFLITAGLAFAAVAAGHPTSAAPARASAAPGTSADTGAVAAGATPSPAGVDATPVAAGSAVLTPYVGTWRVHGADLVINADATATEQIQLGPCTASAGPVLCVADAPLRLESDGRALSFTFTTFTYHDQQGRPVVPAGLDGFPAPGDGYRLRLTDPGVIELEPLTAHSGQILGSRHLCAAHASADAHRRLCNA